MDKLLNDWIVRRAAQIVTLTILVFLVAIQISFIVLVWAHYNDRSYFKDSLLSNVALSIVAFPFGSELGSFVALMTGIVPLVFSSVCYELAESHATAHTTFVSTPVLNRTGHICFIILGLGILIGLMNIIVSYVAVADISDMTDKASVKTFFNSVMSFQVFYLLHLLGMQK